MTSVFGMIAKVILQKLNRFRYSPVQFIILLDALAALKFSKKQITKILQAGSQQCSNIGSDQFYFVIGLENKYSHHLLYHSTELEYAAQLYLPYLLLREGRLHL
jgi:hypothetical protein